MTSVQKNAGIWSDRRGFSENKGRSTYPEGFVTKLGEDSIVFDYRRLPVLTELYEKKGKYFPNFLVKYDALKRFLLPLELTKKLSTSKKTEIDERATRKQRQRQQQDAISENRDPRAPKPPRVKLSPLSKTTVEQVLYNDAAVYYAKFNILAFHCQPVFIETPLLYLLLTGVPSGKFSVATDVLDLYLLVINLVESGKLPIRFTTSELVAHGNIFVAELKYGLSMLESQFTNRGAFQTMFNGGENVKATELLKNLLIQHTLRTLQACERFVWRILEDKYIHNVHSDYIWHGRIKTWSIPLTEADQALQRQLASKVHHLWSENEKVFGTTELMKLDAPVRPGHLPPRDKIEEAEANNFDIRDGVSYRYIKFCLWMAYAGMWLGQANDGSKGVEGSYAPPTPEVK